MNAKKITKILESKIKQMSEADSGRYKITTSGSSDEKFVSKLLDAVEIVKKFPDSARVVITDGNKNNEKVVFGKKETALAILLKMT